MKLEGKTTSWIETFVPGISISMSTGYTSFYSMTQMKEHSIFSSSIISAGLENRRRESSDQKLMLILHYLVSSIRTIDTDKIDLHYLLFASKRRHKKDISASGFYSTFSSPLSLHMWRGVGILVSIQLHFAQRCF